MAAANASKSERLDDHLTINDGRGALKHRASDRDGTVASGPVVAIAGEDPDVLTDDENLRPIAVML